MKKYIRAVASLCLIFSIFSLLAFVPRDEGPLGKLVASLQKWTDTIPQEKVYLHTDKPYYALGDTIWFKGYLTIGSHHQLSALSGAVYVDLINQNDSLMQQLKLPVTAGMIMGNFILKDDYRQGNYRLRAYTQWMRNAGEEYFYDHTFLVGDGAGGNLTAKADFSYKTDKDKPHLQAILSYKNSTGDALANQSLRYEVRRKNKPIWQQNSKTDASGNLAIDIPDEVRQNTAGAYIRTYIKEGKSTIVRDFPIKAGLQQSDVQFFPESGNLVAGLSSRIAFKALGTDGLGINIKGTITDNGNTEVAKIETLHAGMGSFLLRPQAGKTYTANIKFDDGSTKAIPLPPVSAQGYVLNVYQPTKDSLLVRIQASASLMQSSVNIIAHTGGDIILSSPLKIEQPITSIWLSKKSFPTGIAQFTLFDSAGEPLNERIAFVRTNDQMSLDIKTTKTTYGSKERVLAQLNAKNAQGQPTFGNFSVSVIDESKIPFDENKESTIFSNLLLTSDLKGYVEEPNYYFAKSGEDVDKALDNLMLTQGYRRFSWKELNNAITVKPKYAVEGWGSSLSGTVTTLGHKVLPNAKVDLISIRARVAKNTTTDAQGRFSFDDLFITDSIKITIQARNKTKTGLSDKVILTLDSLPSTRANTNKNWPDLSTNISGSLKAYLTAAQKEDDLYEKMGLLDKVHRLRQVNIVAKKLAVPDADITPQGMFKINEQSADQVIIVDADEASHYINLSQYLQARMQGVRIGAGPYGSYLDLLQNNSTFRSSFRNSTQPIALYIDGRRIEHPDAIAEALDSSYDPQDIAKIEVVHSNQAIINFLGGPAVLILTKLGTSRKAGYNPSVANITPKGFNKVREFYVPRYDRLGADLTQPDLRSTVFWSPYLKTDETGKTVFNFYAGDGPGAYKVVVEGINADGQLGRKVYRFTVDANKDFIAAQNAAMVKQANTSAIETALNNFNKRMPTEKIYLHLDRPHYNLNDTLWFKAYVMNGSTLTPSKQSGLMYVEMDDDSTSVVRQMSLRVKDGVAWGQIPMPTKLFHEGAYTLRAYTNWMQNLGPASFYTKRLYLGKADEGSWLLNANASLSKDEKKKDLLNVNLKLNKIDKLSSPVALKSVEVTLYEIRKEEWEFQRWIYREKLQTGIDGSLKFSARLEQKLNGNRVRIRIKSLASADKGREIQTPVSISRNQNIDLQFLPEGGNLVSGLKSVVGFKAIGEDGLSTPVRGDIYTTSGNKVLSFATLHNGMGSFELTPQPGEVYIARLTSPEEKTYKLPVVSPRGTVMRVENPEEGENIKITVNGLKLSADTACYLFGSAKGLIHYSHHIVDGETEFTISKKSFPTGITRFTLFKGLRPVNARMIFIDHQDQFNFSVSTNKADYKTRDSVGLNIEVKDKNGMPVQGNFSLAVTDDSQITPDTLNNFGITAGLLLNSELKGRIESPGYYINRKDKNAWQALDNLMLTQGWVGYDWKDIFAAAAPKFLAEDQLTVKGSVKMLFGNVPSTGAQVLLSSQKPQFLLSTFTDANGDFEFKNLPVIDSGAFFAQINNPKGKPLISADLKITKFIPPKVLPTDNDPVLPWYVNSDTTQINKAKHIIDNQPIDFDPKGTLLKEVQIRKSKIIKDSYYTGPTNLTFDEEDIRKSAQTNLYDVLKQQVHGFRVIFEIRDPFHRDMAIPKIGDDDFVDELWLDANPLIKHHPVQIQSGAIIDRDKPAGSVESMINMLRSYPVAQLKGIQVALSRSVSMLPYAKDYYWAKIFVTTKEGLGSFYSRSKPGTDTYRPVPVVNPEKFYSPKYTATDNSDKTDYRPTIFWEPNITTDANGKAKLSFYTSDATSKYTVKIAGVDGQGGIGDGTYKINDAATDKIIETKKGLAEPTKKATIKAPAMASPRGLKQITDPLDSLNKRMSAEKVYLQTDKPYYNIGDTLWFKSYLLNRSDLMPSHMSGLLYVELINDTAQVVRRVSLPVKDGICWGQIPLNKAIFHESGYTLRAYTNWMQNFDERYFFSQRFYVGVSSTNHWLINTHTALNNVADKNQLRVDMKLSKPDKYLSPLALKKMEVKLFDEWHYIYKKDMTTGIDGSLAFGHELKDKAEARKTRVQLTSQDPDDGGKIVQVPLVVNRDEKIDLQFLPEGGKLITDHKSTVGFKALSEDGKEVTVSGSVFNNKGDKVADFATLHNGMGVFDFTPKHGEIYVAKMIKPVAKSFALPKPDIIGTTMHIDNAEKDDDLKITLAGIKSLPADSDFYLLGTSRGKVFYTKKIETNEMVTASKKLFPSGIARFTLFYGRRPLNERAVFIDHHDQLQINIIANKTSYTKRDSVALRIEVKDKDGFPVKGNFSLAVDDDSQTKPDSLGNNNIMTSLLLSSELKGEVESPGYYINRKDDKAWQALDNLMLTQGWTDYDWGKVFTQPKPAAFRLEKDIVITGVVTNVANKPVPNTQVAVLSAKPNFYATATTDANGRYLFKNLPTIDSGAFFIQANNKNGAKKAFGYVSVEQFIPATPDTPKAWMLPWYVNTDTTHLERIKRQLYLNNLAEVKLTGNVLKQVNIKGNKIIKDSQNPFGPGWSDYAWDERDIKESATMDLYELFQQKLPGFALVNDWQSSGGAVRIKMDQMMWSARDIWLDGSRVTEHWWHVDDPRAISEFIEELKRVKVAGIKGVEVIFSAKYVHGFDGPRIEITTRSGKGWYQPAGTGSAHYRPLPLLYPKQFYSPKYTAKSKLATPDYRSTLYWEPLLITDESGRAKVSFYTSDIKSTYTVKIAGIDGNGKIGDGSLSFNKN